MTTTARDRAEEVFGNLQKRARAVLEAEEGLVQTVRELVETRGFAPQDVRRDLEGLLGRLKTNRLWERVKDTGAVVNLTDYRDDLERKLEASVRRVLGTLQIASQSDLDQLSQQIKTLSRKLDEVVSKKD